MNRLETCLTPTPDGALWDSQAEDHIMIIFPSMCSKKQSIWCLTVFILFVWLSFFLFAWTWPSTHTAHTLIRWVAASQRSLPEPRVHYCSLTSRHLAYPSSGLWVPSVTRLCPSVWMKREGVPPPPGIAVCVTLCFWMRTCAAVVSHSHQLLLRKWMCAIAEGVCVCVVLFVLTVFPHSDPRRGSRRESERYIQREREKEGECHCCPLTPPHLSFAPNI